MKKKKVESKCIPSTIGKLLEWLGFNAICFITFRRKVHEILNYELFLSQKFQINYKN
jgi:hypothetical protein